MRVIYKVAHPWISPKCVLMCALLRAHVLYNSEHKNYSCAPFMKIIEQWHSPYHKSDCFFSISPHARTHSDSSSWLYVCRRRELGMVIERTPLSFFKIFFWSIVDLQCYVSFGCTSKWLRYTNIYIYKYIYVYMCIYSFSDSFLL